MLQCGLEHQTDSIAIRYPITVSSDDIRWQPVASREILELRARVLARIRDFMARRSILEVETPVLHPAGNPDPNINSLTTAVNLPFAGDSEVYYLHTSPEFAMKRLLASGSGPIYQISRVFRDNEAGRIHQPEFTMLEWYRPGFDHHDLMNEIDEMLIELGLEGGERETYAGVFEKFCRLDPHTCDLVDLQDHAAALGLNSAVADRATLLDLVFSHAVSPHLGLDRPVFIYDYPECQAALARLRPADKAVAQRFELFINSIEIANGYNELNDIYEVNNRFESENNRRREQGLEPVKIDRQLLAALEHGMPPCAGVAVGFDRLVMAISGSPDIKDVIAFPVGEVAGNGS